MLEELKERVLKANLDLVKHGLVLFTWGNVSEIDRETGLVAIKPSGVEYDDMKADDIVIVDLEGNVVEGHYKPSSDTPTHLEIYKAFPEVGGVVHTHSTAATAFAQAGCPIIAQGTTHADYFYGDIPCTRSLTKEEVESAYEKNTGKVIIETFNKNKIDIMAVPAVLVNRHGVFTFGKNGDKAVYHAVVTEEVAKMSFMTDLIGFGHGNGGKIQKYVLDKHYNRKHGKNAYYGQGDNK